MADVINFNPRSDIGVWTPNITFATAGDLAVVYASRTGTYTKVGRIVTLHFQILTSTFTHTIASGNLQIDGVPFSSLTFSAHHWTGPCHFQGITKGGYHNFTLNLADNSDFLVIRASASGTNASIVTAADMPTGGTVRLRGSISYEVRT